MGVYPRISKFLRIPYSSAISFISDLCTFFFLLTTRKKGQSFYLALRIFHTDPKLLLLSQAELINIIGMVL